MIDVGARLASRFPTRFPTWHRQIYSASRGLVGHGWTGYGCLLVTTTGRKSGQPRQTVLTYAKVASDYYAAGSNGGNDRPPSWLLNVSSCPTVTVRVGRRQWTTAAEIIELDDSRFAPAWDELNRIREGRYDSYQVATDRPIPLVRFPADEHVVSGVAE